MYMTFLTHDNVKQTGHGLVLWYSVLLVKASERIPRLTLIIIPFCRIPQIIENFQAKSVEGLSLALFVITIIGNFCYGMSILFRLPVIDQQFYLGTLPYLIGSMGTICFDCVILGQACLYGTAWRRMQDEDE